MTSSATAADADEKGASSQSEVLFRMPPDRRPLSINWLRGAMCSLTLSAP